MLTTLPCADERNVTGRPVSFSRVSLAMAVMGLIHANLLGNVHGGEIMKADSTAGATVYRHCTSTSRRRWTR